MRLNHEVCFQVPTVATIPVELSTIIQRDSRGGATSAALNPVRARAGWRP